MLAIRMQRVGRKGHAQFRMVVQDSHFHPTSGRVVAYLGSYNPHSKESQIDKDKLAIFLSNGAQPSPRVVKLLKAEKVKLPSWVDQPSKKKKAVKNPDKRRSTRPAQKEAKDASAEQATPAAEEQPAEPTETAEQALAEKAPADEPQAPAEEPAEAADEAVEEPGEPQASEAEPPKE